MRAGIPEARSTLKTLLEYMLVELLSTRLEVCKIPSKLGGYRRCVLSCNCEWYQKLCKSYTSPRQKYPKHRTIIRRRNTIRALTRMIKGDLRGVYAERILDILKTFD